MLYWRQIIGGSRPYAYQPAPRTDLSDFLHVTVDNRPVLGYIIVPRPVSLVVMTPPFQGGDHRFEPGTGLCISHLELPFQMGVDLLLCVSFRPSEVTREGKLRKTQPPFMISASDRAPILASDLRVHASSWLITCDINQNSARTIASRRDEACC